MQDISFFNWLQGRLALPIPGFEAQRKMMHINRPYAGRAPLTARQSAVLLLLYPFKDDFKLVLIERSDDGGVHSGQVAFPGGSREEFDVSIEATALREAQEEINLNPSIVNVLGHLTSLYIPVSNFEVHPIVGVCGQRPELMPCEMEVADILYFSFHDVFPRKEWVDIRRTAYSEVIRTPAYLLNNRVIWGATAMILSELEELWDEFKNL